MGKMMKYLKQYQILCGFFLTICLLRLWGGSLLPAGLEGEKETEVSSVVWSGRGEMFHEKESAEKRETEKEETVKREKALPPKIALTFDDGPSRYTEKLLEGLQKRGVKASFFMIGESAERNQDLVRRVKEEGHLIGNHTYHHVDVTKLSDEKAREELKEMDRVIYEILGEHVEYMRPPFGVWQEKLEQEIDVLPVMWTIDPLDWTTKNVEEIVNKVVTQAGENDIILLHDCYESSVDAALRIVDVLKAEGYEFVTVDQLILGC